MGGGQKNGWKGVVESIQSVLDSVNFKDRIWYKVFLSIVCFLNIAYVLVCLKGCMCFKYSMVFNNSMDVKCSIYVETGISFCDRAHSRYRSISSCALLSTFSVFFYNIHNFQCSLLDFCGFSMNFQKKCTTVHENLITMRKNA